MADNTPPLELNEVLILGTRPGPNLHSVATSTNVLHYFRSHTSLFTISCVPPTLLTSVDQYELNNAIDNFVIAASGGKNRTTTKFEDQKTTYDGAAAGQSLDKGSRFITSKDGLYLDFFIDDVEVETLADFNQQTGFSKATKLKFSITEPYSLSGFLQTLQAAAVKAGYVTYVSAPFIFRVNFIGYADWEDVADNTPMPIEPASRFFVFRFSEVSVRADEMGTRYQCKAVPLNELGFGQANKLINNITVAGDTVGTILTNFFEKINYISKYSIWTGAVPDIYEIKFPSIDSKGVINEAKENTDLTKWRVGNPDEDNVNYYYENPALIPYAPTKENLYDAKIISTTFAAGANIHDCIAGIIRDSEYSTRIFKQELKSLVDEHGMIDYFNILCSVVPLEWNDKFSRPVYKYTYKVIPHKIHYSRIPKYSNQNIAISQIRKRVRRKYNYLYTGKNLDVLRFELNFNYMYFQAAVNNEGFNELDQASSAAKVSETKASPNVGNFSTIKSIQASYGDAIPTAVDTSNLAIGSAGVNTRAGAEKNPSIALAKNFHKAILENLSQSLLEIEILGDPYYLSHQGMNFFLSRDSNSQYPGISKSGDMTYQTGEIFIEINFRNPTDINPDTGMMDFSDKVTNYSGIYRIQNVTSKFINGMFTQTLKLIKLQRQSENLAEPTNPTGYDAVLDVLPITGASVNKPIIPISDLIREMCSKWGLPTK